MFDDQTAIFEGILVGQTVRTLLCAIPVSIEAIFCPKCYEKVENNSNNSNSIYNGTGHHNGREPIIVLPLIALVNNWTI